MRLTKEQIKLLKNKLHDISAQAKIYLFGSRIDDSKKGGDIDLLVVDSCLRKKDLRMLRVEFVKAYGEQKIDIVLDDGKFLNPFTRLAFSKAVLL